MFALNHQDNTKPVVNQLRGRHLGLPPWGSSASCGLAA